MRSIISLFLLSVPLWLPSQNQITGVILDQNTGQPIENVHIIVKHRLLGALSDQNGLFHLTGFQPNDSLQITCVGYEDKIVDLPDRSPMEFSLRPRRYELSTVPVRGGNPEFIVYGFQETDLDPKRIGSISFGASSSKHTPHSSFGLFIENPSNHVGLIQAVSFYIHNQGKKETPFRLRIYAVDENKQVSREILQENLVISGQIAENWVKVDLREYQIVFPEYGFIVMMEWLITDHKDYFYEVKWKQLLDTETKQQLKSKVLNKRMKGYGQILGRYQMATPQQIWAQINGAWQVIDSNYQPMIQVVMKEWMDN